MERIHLYVEPEEYAEVKASGASWDDETKRWYIGADNLSSAFAHWLGGEEGEGEFGFVSDEAFVAAARVACVECREMIDVICLYLENGTDLESDEPVNQCTLSNVWAVDEGLAAQLERWPFYKKVDFGGPAEGCFVNHCVLCGALQEDYLLHSEPSDVFFSLNLEEAGAVEFVPLEGRVQLSGDCSFGL